MNHEHTAWIEKYRPQTINDCVLPQSLKRYLTDVVSDGLKQDLMFFGSAGTGKTTAAKALCEELGLKYLFINASDDNGIDLVRNQIKTFASSMALGQSSDKPKVIILDEGDYLNANSAQPALRSFISEFAKNTRFILTCNYKNRLIDGLQSRFTALEFSIPKEEKKAMMAAQLDAACDILTKEGVQYNKKVVAEVIMKCFPDFRKTLQELQKYAIISGNNIDIGILSTIGDVNVDSLIGFMKAREFEKVRQWVAENHDNDPAVVLRRVYDGVYPKLEPNSKPHLGILVADYQYKSAFVADQFINLLACLTEIMMGCDFA